MTALVDEMHSAIVALAGPRSSYDSRESMISRAAKAADISYRQAKSFFYRESANPSARVVARVRNALARCDQHSAAAAAAEHDLVARLEAENAILRQFIASTLAGMEGAAALRKKERPHSGHGAATRLGLGPEGLPHSPVAQAAGASR